MDEILQLTLLYDFYGELLTAKQKLVYELFYQNDLSLTEIGQELNISRQAVRDQLKTTERLLQDYEDKLNLVERFRCQRVAVKKINEIILEIELSQELTQKSLSKIQKIKNITEQILE